MISRELAMVIAFAAGLAGAVAEAQQGNTISVPVSGLQNNTGEVRCGLFNSAASFPKNDQRFMGVESRCTSAAGGEPARSARHAQLGLLGLHVDAVQAREVLAEDLARGLLGG